MEHNLYKLEIFVPESHFEQVRQALWQQDAGHIGNYDRCMSWSKVQSCWRSLPGTTPYHGQTNVLSQVEEIKIEVCCQAQWLERTLLAVKKAHPYEEAVINVLPLLATGL